MHHARAGRSLHLRWQGGRRGLAAIAGSRPAGRRPAPGIAVRCTTGATAVRCTTRGQGGRRGLAAFAASRPAGGRPAPGKAVRCTTSVQGVRCTTREQGGRRGLAAFAASRPAGGRPAPGRAFRCTTREQGGRRGLAAIAASRPAGRLRSARQTGSLYQAFGTARATRGTGAACVRPRPLLPPIDGRRPACRSRAVLVRVPYIGE